jgi:hypothetical protein
MGWYPGGIDLNEHVPTEKIKIKEAPEGGGFFTKKKTSFHTIGDYVYIIAGIGSPKRFYLWNRTFVTKVEPDGEFFVASGKVEVLKNPCYLNNIEGFDDFKHFNGNFGLGLQNISNHPFSKVLASYFKP